MWGRRVHRGRPPSRERVRPSIRGRPRPCSARRSWGGALAGASVGGAAFTSFGVAASAPESPPPNTSLFRSRSVSSSRCFSSTARPPGVSFSIARETASQCRALLRKPPLGSVTLAPGGHEAREPVVRHAAREGVLRLLGRGERVEVRLEDAEERQRLLVLVGAVMRAGPIEVRPVGGAARGGDAGREQEGRREQDGGTPHGKRVAAGSPCDQERTARSSACGHPPRDHVPWSSPYRGLLGGLQRCKELGSVGSPGQLSWPLPRSAAAAAGAGTSSSAPAAPARPGPGPGPGRERERGPGPERGRERERERERGRGRGRGRGRAPERGRGRGRARERERGRRTGTSTSTERNGDGARRRHEHRRAPPPRPGWPAARWIPGTALASSARRRAAATPTSGARATPTASAGRPASRRTPA